MKNPPCRLSGAFKPMPSGFGLKAPLFSAFRDAPAGAPLLHEAPFQQGIQNPPCFAAAQIPHDGRPKSANEPAAAHASSQHAAGGNESDTVPVIRASILLIREHADDRDCPIEKPYGDNRLRSRTSNQTRHNNGFNKIQRRTGASLRLLPRKRHSGRSLRTCRSSDSDHSSTGTNFDFGALQRGQRQVSGNASNGVPEAIPCSGSPTAGS